MDVDEKDYVESEDEDFNPEDAVKDEDVSASSDEEEAQPVSKQKKKTSRKRQAGESDELDSGDEVTIRESRRKKRKKGGEDADDSEGEGGLVKTRAQRKAEKEEKQERRRADRGEVTIDVDAIWAKLHAAPVGRPLIEELEATSANNASDDNENGPEGNKENVQAHGDTQEEFITINQTYEFAGQTVSEEKRVHRDSAEAKLYLSKHSDKAPDTPTMKLSESGLALRRPLKRASMFEPNPTGEVKGLPAHKQRLRQPSRADVLAQQKRLDEEAKSRGDKATRLNTVQKSKLDWATHVDAEGLKDELAEYDRSKQGYMGKMDFLQDVQGRREQEERAARLQKV